MKEIMNDEDGALLEAAHANYRVRIKTPPVKPMSMLRIARADLDGAVVQRESR